MLALSEHDATAQAEMPAMAGDETPAAEPRPADGRRGGLRSAALERASFIVWRVRRFAAKIRPELLLQPAFAWVGIMSVALGAAGTVVLGSRTGPDSSATSWAALAMIAWAGIRLLTMLAVQRTHTDLVRGAWALGSIAFAIAWTPDSRLAAYVLSAAITFATLAWLKLSARRAFAVVTVAWGLQALVVLAVAVTRSAMIFSEFPRVK